MDRYPLMTFKLTNYQKVGDQYSAVGDLTLHGVTKPITLVGNMIGIVKDPTGRDPCRFCRRRQNQSSGFQRQFSRPVG